MQGNAQEIRFQTRMVDNEVRMMRQEKVRLSHERDGMIEKIQDNTTKIKQNKVLPYLVSKVVEVGPPCARAVNAADEQILDVEEEAQEGATHNAHSANKTKCATIKTTTRQVGA